jgi:hypothetical protein
MIWTFLKKYWREMLIVLLVIVVTISFKTCKSYQADADIYKNKSDSTYNKATAFVNKNNQLVWQVKTYALTIKDLKKHGNELGFENSSLKKQVGSLNNLVAHWRGKASIRDTVKTVLHDTTIVINGIKIAEQTFSWGNKYMVIDGAIVEKKITIGYKYSVDFSLTAYRAPKKGLFRPPGPLVADIYFNDPNFKVNEFKGFVIQENRKRWYETNVFKYSAGALLGGYATYKGIKALK